MGNGFRLLLIPKKHGMGYPDDFDGNREYEFMRDGDTEPSRFRLADQGVLFNVAGLKYREISDDWKPDERTVLHCMETLRNNPDRLGMTFALKYLESLLPKKKDRAKELVEEWFQAHDDEASNGDALAFIAEKFARWLISTGKLS